MTKKFSFLQKTLATILTSTLMLSMLFIASSCGDDDDADPEFEMPGIYTFKSATLQTPIKETINFGGFPIEVDYPAGQDITSAMAGGLLGEIGCNDPDNGAVDLKSSNELFYTCIGESNEVKAGGWEYHETNAELDLNLSSPPLPTAVQLKLESVVVTEASGEIAGTIKDFPMTPDLMIGFIPSQLLLTLNEAQIADIMAQLPQALFVDVDIVFDKVE